MSSADLGVPDGNRSETRSFERSRAKVDALLNPRNIVIVGATDKTGNWAQRIWRNIHRYGFAGAVFPINPHRETVWGTRCYSSCGELPEQPDHIVVVIPAALVPDLLIDAARAGARSATIMTSGFGETSESAARTLAARLKSVIDETGLAVSGPNCLGNLNVSSKLMTMPDDRPHRFAPGSVAIISQSGGIATAIKRTLEERGIDTASVVTTGNEVGLTTADYIAYFASVPSIRVIISYLEAVQDAASFLTACRSARDVSKPIVVIKLGGSEEGRAAAMAHTGALAGSMDAFDAVAEGAGVIRAPTPDDVTEIVEYFLHAPLPSGGGLGGVTFSGGVRGLLLDAAQTHHLTFSPLAPATLQRIASSLPAGAVIGNPLDSGFTGVSNSNAYIQCVEALLDDPGVDILLLQEELPRGPGTEGKESNLLAVEKIATSLKKPIVFTTVISHALTDYSRTLRERLPHVCFLQEVDKTMRTIQSITKYASRSAAPVRLPTLITPRVMKGRLERFLSSRAVLGRRAALSEVDSKELLKAYGIRGPREAIARSESEAVTLSRTIGYPVVAKAVSSELAHKSEAGGVILGLSSAEDVRRAYARLRRTIGHRLGAAFDGVLIAEQVSGGLELVLGATRDSEMGPVILFGSGGVALELFRDVALAAPPLDERAAADLIERTRSSKLIQGFRGRSALDRDAAVEALVRLSWLVVDAGERIDSIDINPFLLRRRGGVALDGLVVLSGSSNLKG